LATDTLASQSRAL